MKVKNIQNGTLSVNVNLTGAELVGLKDLRDGVEHMWHADPKFWPRTAPILFPTIGESRDGKVWFDGVAYPMGRHGFVRHMDFTVLTHEEDIIELELVSSPETRKHYPFDFKFRTSYRLYENNLYHRFEIENVGDKPLPFQLGAHPAFAVPFGSHGSFDDYEIRFDEKITVDRHLLNAEGLYNGKTRRFLDNQDRFGLSYDLFNEDAIVMKNMPVDRLWIQHKEGGKKLEVQYEWFPNMGIWSVPGADYVCIEPWNGSADQFDQPKDFMLKDGVIVRNPNGTFAATYCICLISQ